MKKKKFWGSILFALAAILVVPGLANAEEYYRVSEIKGDNTVLGTTNKYSCPTQEEPNKQCENFYPVSISAEWNGDKQTGHGQLYLSQYYEYSSNPYKTFSMKITGNDLDEKKNYVLEYTSYDGSVITKDYTGKQLLDGIKLELEPKGTYKLILKEKETKTVINAFAYDPCEYDYSGTCTNPIVTYEQVNIEFSNWHKELVDLFESISKDGVIKVNALEPSEQDFQWTVTSGIKSLIPDGYTAYASYAYDYENNKQDTTRTIIDLQKGEGMDAISQSFEVKFEFVKADPEVAKKVDAVADKFETDWQKLAQNTDEWYLLTDLENINYLFNSAKVKSFPESKLPNYSSKIQALTDDEKISFDFTGGAGMAVKFYDGCIGAMSILYDEIVYKTVEPVGFISYNIIYVPSDTAKTRDAFIAAAKARIEAYLTGSKIEITYGGKIADLEEPEYKPEYINEETDEWEYVDIFDVAKTTGEWYTVSIDGKEYPFIIASDSSLMNNPVVKTQDSDTNVLVKTTSYDAPLDAKVKVKKLDPKSAEYKALAEKFKIVDELSFDLNLFSTSLDMYISELADGSFEVYIPIDKSLANKNLIAVYVKADGTLENHPIEIKDGYAIFTTNHFSTYSIIESNNPKTGDNVFNLILMMVVSIGGLALLKMFTQNKNEI